ncbi:dynamin family protein [Virgibacillus proomii]|jgi:predicted GTPase|uniref:dynamin family protein n=1 Tax=Virgibacillus proomii TaxID=84407 RepID=UPI000984CDBD|nr:dynamin family protein [Virgibacillus proomii]
MGSTTTISSAPLMFEKIAFAYQKMLDHQDQVSAEKILDLYKKYKEQELMICFAGHFSAGKSSMINTLLDHDILPNSPIPTSANIVKVTSGGGYVRVYFKDQEPEEYAETVDVELIKQYSMDKDRIVKIEISTSTKLLPRGTAFVDTPGIDAADDADRLMTEASLHLMDALFYVMDYNHVQSEVNLQFLKDVQDKSIPFYIIINQIDKHVEEELSFSDFEDSIKQTLALWEIEPEQIFYSSLYEPNLEKNQLEDIKETLNNLLTTRKSELLSSDHTLQEVIKQHDSFLRVQYEEKLEAYRIPTEEREKLAEIKTKQIELQEMDRKEQQLKTDFQAILQQTVKNAYLMPATLRDKAAAFLESHKSDFKIGLFGAKKKTEEERRKRTHDFLAVLQQTVEATLQWKLRDKWQQLFKANKVDDIHIRDYIQDFSIIVDQQDIIEVIKQGATVSGDYILHYTNDLAQAIKTKAKHSANTLWADIETYLQKRNQPIRTNLLGQLTELKEIQKTLNRYDQLKDELDKKQAAIRQTNDAAYSLKEAAIVLIEEALQNQHNRIKQVTQPKRIPIANNLENMPFSSDKKVTSSNETKHHANTIEMTIDSIEKTMQIVDQLPGFKTLMHDLQRKKQRLKNRIYTITLFGAFSAGKSSFANALMGEGVLPVSPNPTTATINRINPVDHDHQHGTIIGKVKSHERLVDELTTITKKFSPAFSNLDDLIGWIKREKIYCNESLANTYQSYLKAVINGYKSIRPNIGHTITLSLDEFPAYVTDESKACFLETMDLYYDCELTRQGIRLVDTPGADSVNARHTDVAFDYIKHADAILYVTYYNHALNRADKDFLMQLGRVKDSFQLDKMFFIVNAADLAKDERELTLVTDYVQEQLLQLAIRFPRLYPVSSRNALINKQKHQHLDTLMVKFETEFYQFIHEDLTKLMVASAFRDIERMEQQLEHFIASQKLDQQEKEVFKQSILDKQSQLQQVIDDLDSAPYLNQIKQKIEKQLYYVLERLAIRFHDLFKETFNPATITENGRQAKKQLWDCLEDLITYCQTELIRELQAVSLRMEAFIHDIMIDAYKEMERQSKQIDTSFLFAEAEINELASPDFSEAFQDMDRKSFDRIINMFKNTKAFFEKNEKEQMKNAIYTVLQPFAQQYMETNEQSLGNFYKAQSQDMIDYLRENVTEQLQNHIQRSLATMTSTISVDQLISKQQEIREIIANSRWKEG